MFQFLKNAAANVRGQHRPGRRHSHRLLSVEGLEDRCLLAGTADLQWSTFLGGAGDDRIQELVVDEQGDVYVVGSTTSPDFPVSPGAFDSTPDGNGDVFVAKVSAGGARVLWATYLGGGGRDAASDLVYDAVSGALYVVGYTESLDFPSTEGAFDRVRDGRIDGFVVKMSAGDGQVYWSTLLGEGQEDSLHALTLGPDGSLYIVGSTNGTQITTNAGVVMRQSATTNYAFVARVSSDGRALLNAAFINDSPPNTASASFARDVAVDAGGGVYVTGMTTRPDVSVTKWSFDLRVQLWRIDLRGSHVEEPVAIVLDGPQSGVVFGQTRSRDFPVTSGAYDTTHAGGLDLFVTKFATDTGTIAWSTFVGEGWNDYARDIAVSPRGLALCGDTGPGGYPTTPDAYDRTYNGSTDVVVSWLGSQGDALVYSTYLGGQGGDGCLSIVADAAGGVSVAGRTRSSDFPVSRGGYDQTWDGDYDGGDYDGFVAHVLPEFAPNRDTVGPHVTAVGPTGAVPGLIDTLEVTFDESVAATTFTQQDVVLTTPDGAAVRVRRVRAITDTVFHIEFDRQSRVGEYRLTIGPDVRDWEGNPMDQDGDGRPGELIEDRFTGTFEIIPRTFVFFFLGFCGQVGEDPPSGMETLRATITADPDLAGSVVAAPPLGWPDLPGLLCQLTPFVVRRQMAAARLQVRQFLKHHQYDPLTDRVVLIGHSYGGNVAYELAVERAAGRRRQKPDPVEGLVTLDPIDWRRCSLFPAASSCDQSGLQRVAPKGILLTNILGFVQRSPTEPEPFAPLVRFRGYEVTGGRTTVFSDTWHQLIDNDVGLGPDLLPGRASIDDDANGEPDDASEAGTAGTDDRKLQIYDAVLEFLEGLLRS